MNIVGFNFTKISAERKRSFVGQVQISNNISLKEVREAKLGINDRGALGVTFLFGSTYAPEVAKIEFEGDVLLLMESKRAKTVLDDWTKTKRLPPDVAQGVLNHILERCNIQALLVARDFGLPSPVPLPKVKMDGAAAAKPEKKSKK